MHRSINRVLTCEQMTRADAATIKSGIDGFDLMKRAGNSAFEDICQNFEKNKTTVLCGGGNNGGDGFIVAKLLKNKGWSVQVACLISPEKLKGDAAKAFDFWNDDVFSFDEIEISKSNLVIDAIFGTGLSKPLTDNVKNILQKAKHCKVVAIDIPSGVDGSNGNVYDGAIKAARTVTFAYKKLGHLLQKGSAMCGEIKVCDIGIKSDAYSAFENSPQLWSLPRHEDDCHKYNKGHCVIFGGCSMEGAAILAARGAMRAGAGLCTVVAHKRSEKIYRCRMPDNILFETLSQFSQHIKDPRRNAFLAGCGIVTDLRDSICNLLATKKPAVLDAGAITCFENDTARFYNALHENIILTPHEGEFSRIFPDLKGNKLERTQKAANICGCTVLLKGADTVIAAPNKTPVINSNGCKHLATAGSGDVLAGLILGLLSQGMSPFDAACAGAWIHGYAGSNKGAGLIASDIIEAVPEVLSRLETISD